MCFSDKLFKKNLTLKPKEKVVFILLLLAIIAEIMFIFSNSTESAAVSSDKSGAFVTIFIEKILGIFIGEAPENLVYDVTYFIRKLAHFTEFAVLSATFSGMLSIFRLSFKKILWSASVFSFSVGCIDEFIQLFSEGRACRFSDVIIDTLGGLSGALMLVIITCIFSHKKTL